MARRIFILTAVFLVGMAAAAPRGVTAYTSPQVAAVWGELWVLRQDEREVVRPGADLRVGDRLLAGSGDRAKVLFAAEGILDLAPDSEVVIHRLPEVPGASGRIELIRGKVRARWIAGESDSPRYQIETPSAVVVRGADYIVSYDTDLTQTELVALRDGVEVVGRIGIAGGSIALGTREASVIRRGQFPGSPERVADARYQQALHGFTIVGTGGRDGLASGHPAITGRLLSPRDLPEAVPAEAEVGRGIVVEAPREFLADEMSSDFRVHDQPLNEYLRQRTGGIDVEF